MIIFRKYLYKVKSIFLLEVSDRLSIWSNLNLKFIKSLLEEKYYKDRTLLFILYPKVGWKSLWNLKFNAKALWRSLVLLRCQGKV
jgi:hypothetical protein